MAVTHPIRDKNLVEDLASFYRKRGQLRNHVLVVLGLFTALRISDLLRLRWDDVYDFKKGCVKTSIFVLEKKTGKSKTIALNKSVVKAITKYAAVRTVREGFLIENPNTRRAISRIQAYRLIRAASDALGFHPHVSCHSLRKTFGYHAWKNGVHPVILMDIYNHCNLEVTKRYLGVTQDDRDSVYLGLSFGNKALLWSVDH